MSLKQIKIKRSLPEADKLLDLVESFNERAFIAGSFALWMVQEEEMFIPNDIDIWFKDNIQFLNFIVKLKKIFKTKKITETNRAITYELITDNEELCLKVQLLKSFYGTPEEVVEQFDINNCMCIVISNTSAFAISSLTPRIKTLGLNNVNNPYNTALRLIKYAKRGFDVDIHTIDSLFYEYEQKIKIKNDLFEQVLKDNGKS